MEDISTDNTEDGSGRIYIPKTVVKEFNFKNKEKLLMILEKNKIILRKLDSSIKEVLVNGQKV